jgi:hypothetical protein
MKIITHRYTTQIRLEIVFYVSNTIVKDRIGTVWGMLETIIGSVIAGNVLVCLLLRHYATNILLKIDEFILEIKNIDLTSSFEMNGEAMEAQIQAQKQAQIFEFLKSLVQPQISVSEIQKRDDSGKFA